jgi:hypothetical protein
MYAYSTLYAAKINVLSIPAVKMGALLRQTIAGLSAAVQRASWSNACNNRLPLICIQMQRLIGEWGAQRIMQAAQPMSGTYGVELQTASGATTLWLRVSCAL